MAREEYLVKKEGTIQKIEGGIAYVAITCEEACKSCSARNACHIVNDSTKTIEVTLADDTKYDLQENVEVLIRESLCFKAVFLGYLLPFLLMVASLVIGTAVALEEVYVALSTITLLVPYYMILYFFKERLKKSFSFKIRKKGIAHG